MKIYTEEYLQKMGLNGRRIKAVMYVKEKEKITNKEYREINNVSNKTAYLELKELVKRDILLCKERGKSTEYMLKSNEKVTKG